MKSILAILLIIAILLPHETLASLGAKINENGWQYGKELITKQFSKDDGRKFAGKKVYPFPRHGWQVEVLYRDGKSYSEVARPKGDKVAKKILSIAEANVIADMLYPKKERGSYRKQIDNAHFISHFFEHGVVSFEMQLDNRKKHHLGVIGVRTILYSNGDRFKDIKVNAYH